MSGHAFRMDMGNLISVSAQSAPPSYTITQAHSFMFCSDSLYALLCCGQIRCGTQKGLKVFVILKEGLAGTRLAKPSYALTQDV